jgi:hypothetical protein
MIGRNKSKAICRSVTEGTVCKYGDQCKFSHVADQQPNKQPRNTRHNVKDKKVKNTENFKPSHVPADIRLLVENASNQSVTKLNLQTQDVIVVTDLFGKDEELTIYKKLLEEMAETGIDSEKLWKLWHGDTHYIADDHLNYKDKVPTFMMVINRIKDYFNMDIKATRFNLYQNDQWKPFHHDASAIDPEKAKIQNFTVGVSFGAPREIAFEDAINPPRHRRVISIVLPNATTYAFTRDINVNWKHGVPQLPPNKRDDTAGRISIIAWGYINQTEAGGVNSPLTQGE